MIQQQFERVFTRAISTQIKNHSELSLRTNWVYYPDVGIGPVSDLFQCSQASVIKTINFGREIEPVLRIVRVSSILLFF